MHKLHCKYCGQQMDKVLMPPISDWGVDFLMICMNDECSYYTQGWAWMKEKYKVHATYRFQINTYTGYQGPIPVKNPNDMKDWMVKRVNVNELEESTI